MNQWLSMARDWVVCIDLILFRPFTKLMNPLPHAFVSSQSLSLSLIFPLNILKSFQGHMFMPQYSTLYQNFKKNVYIVIHHAQSYIVIHSLTQSYIVLHSHTQSYIVIHSHTQSYIVIHSHTQSYKVIHSHMSHKFEFDTTLSNVLPANGLVNTGLIF